MIADADDRIRKEEDRYYDGDRRSLEGREEDNAEYEGNEDGARGAASCHQ